MDIETEFRNGDPGYFAGRGGCELVFHFFESSNEEIIDKGQKEEVCGEMWGNFVRGGGTCKNPLRLCVGWSYENC